MNKLKLFLSRKYVNTYLFLMLSSSVFFYIWIFGINLLYWDEWTFATMVENFQRDGWSFDLLFKQHNEHRLFFPRMFYLLSLPLSNMNSMFYMHFNAIMICIEFLFLYTIAKRQFQFTNYNIPVWLIILPLFIFNFRQWENIIWAFQIAFYIVLVTSIAAFYFIEKLVLNQRFMNKVLYFTIVIALAIIATFSSAMGFLVWIAGAFQFAIHLAFGKQKKIALFLVSFILIGILALSFYLKDLVVPMNENFNYAASHPFKFIYFFLCLISLTSIKWLSTFAFFIGTTILLVSLFAIYQAYKNKKLTDNSFWLATYVFSMLFALITSIGRAPMDFGFTDRSRYTTFTMLITVSTFMLLYDYYRTKPKMLDKYIIKIFFYCLIILSIELNAVGLVYGYLNKKSRLQSKEIVLNYKTRSLNELQELDAWLPDEFIEEVKKAAPFVEQNEYNVFKK